MDYLEIMKTYTGYYQSLISIGKFPIKKTALGLWGVADLDLTYIALKEILSQGGTFLDLGSGDGKICNVAKIFCENVVGVEIDDELIDLSRQMSHPDIQFFKDDFYNIDISKFDYIFINPDKYFDERMQNKLTNELNGKLIVYSCMYFPTFLKKEREWDHGVIKIREYSKD